MIYSIFSNSLVIQDYDLRSSIILIKDCLALRIRSVQKTILVYYIEVESHLVSRDKRWDISYILFTTSLEHSKASFWDLSSALIVFIDIITVSKKLQLHLARIGPNVLAILSAVLLEHSAFHVNLRAFLSPLEGTAIRRPVSLEPGTLSDSHSALLVIVPFAIR
jgi:hypothetical protein